VASYREQTVEIALGPKGAFENGNIGALRRRMLADKVVSAVPPSRGNPKPPREPKTPRVVELLRKAVEWQALLESGKIASQADIARREDITRARVTQVMGMLRLAPEIQEHILSMPDIDHRPPVSERMLRPIEFITDHRDQLREFHRLLVWCSKRLRQVRRSANSHPWVATHLRFADGRDRGRSLYHHEGDGANRHKNDDDLPFSGEAPQPGAGRKT
jgi:hypothetical protein